MAFTIAIPQGRAACERVLLRRLVDVRFSPQRAALWIDGEAHGVLSSSDRDIPHVLTSWKVDTIPLPPAATRGKAAVRVRLHVQPEQHAGSKEFAAWTRSAESKDGAWTEARWQALCVPLLEVEV